MPLPRAFRGLQFKFWTERLVAYLHAPVISNPADPKFDLEAYLTMKMADEAK